MTQTLIDQRSKQCQTCREVKHSYDFGRETRSKDGLRFRCRQCRKREVAQSSTAEFWSQTTVCESGCIEWTGPKSKGYGLYHLNGKLVRAHRYAWALTHGQALKGLDVCHHCDNPACVNIVHRWRSKFRRLVAATRSS